MVSSKYISAYSGINSTLRIGFAWKIKRLVLQNIQIHNSNTIAVQVGSLTSYNGGASIKIIVRIILVQRVEISATVQWFSLMTFMKSMLASGTLSSLNVSSASSFLYLHGKHCF